MNREYELIRDLERLGSTMASGPSMVAGVMDRVSELPPPVRRSSRVPKAVLAGVVALATGVLVALSAWFMGHGDSSMNIAANDAPGGRTSTEEPTKLGSLPPAVDPSSSNMASADGLKGSAFGECNLGEFDGEDPPFQMGMFGREPDDRDAALGALGRLGDGELLASQEFSRASAVLRAKMVATEDNGSIIVYEITKLIYGRFPGKTLRQWNGPRVMNAPKIFKEGKEVTLYVYREYKRKDGTVICGIHFGVGDENEKRILDIVKAGTHLLPGKGPHYLPFYISNCQRIVRAKLVKRDDDASHWWDVSETVCSSSKDASGRVVWKAVPKDEDVDTKEGRPLITVSMTPWWLRAEAIVRARGTEQNDTEQTDPEQTKKQIREEFNRLVSTDLRLTRGAILFLRPNDDPAEKALYTPAFVFPADPNDSGYLNRLEEKIREIIERGQYENTHL